MKLLAKVNQTELENTITESLTKLGAENAVLDFDEIAGEDVVKCFNLNGELIQTVSLNSVYDALVTAWFEDKKDVKILTHEPCEEGFEFELSFLTL